MNLGSNITGHVTFKSCYNFSKSNWKQPKTVSSQFSTKPFTLDHFTMRHPVQPECTAYFIFRYILTIYLQAMNNLISKLEKVDARKMFDVPKIKRSCLKSWSNWIGWLLSWLFSFCEGRDCREDGKSRNTAAWLVGGLHARKNSTTNRQPYWTALLYSLIVQPYCTTLLYSLIAQRYCTALL